MSKPLEELIKTLKKHGQSVTKTRQIVFSVMEGKEPMTFNEINKACLGYVDRASIYRTIALFEKIGVVQRLQIGWKYKLELSDSFHNHHHHLTCKNCGRTTPLPEDQLLEARLEYLSKSRNFVMYGHQLEIQGLCLNCQQNIEPARNSAGSLGSLTLPNN